MATEGETAMHHEGNHYVWFGPEHFTVRHSWNCFIAHREHEHGMQSCEIHRALECLDEPPALGDYVIRLYVSNPFWSNPSWFSAPLEVVIDGRSRWIVLTRVRHA